MKLYIKPKNLRECEIWDSGWRCGLTFGIVINFLIAIAIILFT